MIFVGSENRKDTRRVHIFFEFAWRPDAGITVDMSLSATSVIGIFKIYIYEYYYIILKDIKGEFTCFRDWSLALHGQP